MPPITPTLQVDSTVMTNNWSGGLANPTNQQKLVYKYTHPKKLFNADPQGAQTAFQTGVTRAIAANKYANGMAKADTNKAADNMTNYGGANWSTAGTTKKYKYAAVAPALAAAINTVLSIVWVAVAMGVARLNGAPQPATIASGAPTLAVNAEAA